jgi:5-methylcytosine-specific restriction endonuclease McrA
MRLITAEHLYSDPRLARIPRDRRARCLGALVIAASYCADYGLEEVPEFILREVCCATLGDVEAMLRVGVLVESDGAGRSCGGRRWLRVAPELLDATASRARIPVSPDVRAGVYARDDYQCVVCGTSDDLTLDHIRPWARGGTNDPDNLQTMCRPHNSEKGAKVS